MAFDRTGGFGQVVRSLSLAKSPAQMTLAFFAFTAFFLLNRLFFPDYEPTILRSFGSHMHLALIDTISGFQVDQAGYHVAEAFKSFTLTGFGKSLWVMGLFYFLVWLIVSFLFGAITRIAAVQAGLGQKIGLRDAVRYVVSERRWFAYFLPPLYFIGAFLATLVISGTVLGGLSQIPIFGGLFASVTFPLVFFIAMFSMIVAISGVLTFPFHTAAVSVDGSSSFDVVSRTCTYIFPRLPRFLLYCVFAIAVGTLALLAVSAVVTTTIDLSFHTLDFWWEVFGKGETDLEEDASVNKYTRVYNEMIEQYRLGETLTPAPTYEEPRHLESFAATVIGLFVWIVLAMIPAYGISYALSSSTVIYMLLRRDVDGTPLEEIYSDEEAYEEELLDEVIQAQSADGSDSGGPASQLVTATLDRTTQAGPVARGKSKADARQPQKAPAKAARTAKKKPSRKTK